MSERASKIHRRRKIVNGLMATLTATFAFFAVSILPIILSYIAVRGVSSLDLQFLIDTPKPVGEGGGIGNAGGSLLMTVLASAIGLPIGIGAGVYLVEFGRSWYGNATRFVADTLIGVPSIIVGIFVYTMVVLPMSRQSGLAGGLELAIIMTPIVARTTEEMILLVPNSMREGAFALGAPQWRVTWNNRFTGGFDRNRDRRDARNCSNHRRNRAASFYRTEQPLLQLLLRPADGIFDRSDL